MDTANKQQYDQYLKEIRISKDMLETAKSKRKIEGKIKEKTEMILAYLMIRSLSLKLQNM